MRIRPILALYVIAAGQLPFPILHSRTFRYGVPLGAYRPDMLKAWHACVCHTLDACSSYTSDTFLSKKRGIKSSEKISTCLPPRRRWQVRVFCCIMMFFHGHVDQITPRSLGVFDFHAPVSLSRCLSVCLSITVGSLPPQSLY